MKISEVINSDHLNWQRGHIVAISAGTGKGKSFFIKNKLYKHAKEEGEQILFLIHRSNTAKQFYKDLDEVGKLDHITIMTYQQLQADVLYAKPIDLNRYKYIVCDEYHYFSNDSSFNKYTDLALNEILRYQKNSIIILMSATGDFIGEYLENVLNISMKKYEIPVSFEFINSIDFYTEEEQLKKLLRHQLEKNKKTIIFMDSAKACYELYELFKENSIFVCSEFNEKFANEMNIEKRDRLLRSAELEELFLFTTQTLDAGLNIEDKELECIVVDIADIDTLIQCIGRKRLENNEKIKLLVRNRTKKMLDQTTRKIDEKLKHAEFLLKEGENNYIKKFYRNPDKLQIVYLDSNENGEIQLKINNLAYQNLIHKRVQLEEIKSLPNGYMEYIEKLFDKKDSILHDRYLEKSTSELLEKYYQEKIIIEGKEHKSEFANALNLKNGRNVLKTLSKINEVLNGKGTSYRLVQIDNRRRGGKDKRAWVVQRAIKEENGKFRIVWDDFLWSK